MTPNVWVTYAGCQPDRRAQQRLCARVRQLATVLHPRFDAGAWEVRIALEGPVAVEARRASSPVELNGFHAGGIELRLLDVSRIVRRLPFLFARAHASPTGEPVVPAGQLVFVEERREIGCPEEKGARGAPWRVTSRCFEVLDYQFAAEFALMMCYVRRFHVPRLVSSCFDPLPYWDLFGMWADELRDALRRGPVSLADARGAWRSHLGRGASGSAPDLPGWFDEWVAQKGTLEAAAFGLVAAEFAG